MSKDDLILAELRELRSQVDAMATPAARAARREAEAQDAEAQRAEREHLRKVNAPAVEKLLASAAKGGANNGGQDAPRNTHGAKGNGTGHR